MKEYRIEDESKLQEIAGEMIQWIGDSLVVCLVGEMGAGKTTLVRYLMQELGTTQDVSSPTFAIANEYVPQNGPWQGVYHLDLYRLRSLDEVRALPLSDYTESGYLCLIEWPQIAADELPEDTKVLRIEAMENGSRKIVFL